MKMFKVLMSLVFLSASSSLACQDSTAPNRVVYIGDSHTAGSFGQRLALNMTKLYDTTAVKRYGVIGAAAQHWNKKENSTMQKLKIGYYCDGDGNKNGAVPNNFPTPTQLFLGAAPQRVVIALGTNDVHNGCLIKDKDAQMAATRELISQIRPGSKCTWVGPTQQNSAGPIVQRCGVDKINAYIENLKSTVSTRCSFVDSRKLQVNGKPIVPNAGDKMHFDSKLGSAWADEVARAMGGLPVNTQGSPAKKQGQAN